MPTITRMKLNHEHNGPIMLWHDCHCKCATQSIKYWNNVNTETTRTHQSATEYNTAEQRH